MNSPTSTIPTPSAQTWPGPSTRSRLRCEPEEGPAAAEPRLESVPVGEAVLTVTGSDRRAARSPRDLRPPRAGPSQSLLRARTAAAAHRSCGWCATHRIRATRRARCPRPRRGPRANAGRSCRLVLALAEVLLDHLAILALGHYDQKGEIADQHQGRGRQTPGVDAVIEATGDERCSLCGIVAELLPLRRHARVLMQAFP